MFSDRRDTCPAGDDVNWADHNPEKIQLPAQSTLMRAFEEAFPCKK